MNIEIKLEDIYTYRFSNGDILEDKLKNFLNLIETNGLDVVGCINSGRLKKK